eukprot:5523797-Pyramimonas_sp.AAC.1
MDRCVEVLGPKQDKAPVDMCSRPPDQRNAGVVKVANVVVANENAAASSNAGHLAAQYVRIVCPLISRPLPWARFCIPSFLRCPQARNQFPEPHTGDATTWIVFADVGA